MHRGISLLEEGELTELSQLIGLSPSAGGLNEALSLWVAGAVKKSGHAPEDIERVVLESVAKSFSVTHPPTIDTDNLERAIRLKMAQLASEFLTPGWVLCCALVAVGQGSRIPQKLDLLEQSAASSVPSGRVRKQKRQEWERFCAHWQENDPGPELEPYLAHLRDQPQLRDQFLTLGLAISLLDGKISFPSERLYRDVCDQLGMGRSASDALQNEVTSIYWKYHNAGVPNTSKETQRDPIGPAVQRTVHECGALDQLYVLSRENLLQIFQPKEEKKSWSRLVGGLFSGKGKEVQANLNRVVHRAIVKQHDGFFREQLRAELELKRQKALEERKSAAPAPQNSGELAAVANTPQQGAVPAPAVEASIPPVQPAAPAQPQQVAGAAALGSQPVSLSDQMVDPSATPKRKIKLDL